MFAVGSVETPSRAEQVVGRPPQHTLANPKMILTFSQSSLSHCGWATNNFTASCVAAATPTTAHSAYFMNIINIMSYISG